MQVGTQITPGCEEHSCAASALLLACASTGLVGHGALFLSAVLLWQGTFIEADGSKYEGEFKDGRMHGQVDIMLLMHTSFLPNLPAFLPSRTGANVQCA